MDGEFAVAEVEGLFAGFVEAGAVRGGELDAVLDDGEAGCCEADSRFRIPDSG